MMILEGKKPIKKEEDKQLNQLGYSIKLAI